MKWNEEKRKEVESRKERLKEIDKARIAMEQRKFKVQMMTGELYAESGKLDKQCEEQEKEEVFTPRQQVPCTTLTVPLEYRRATRTNEQPPSQQPQARDSARGNAISTPSYFNWTSWCTSRNQREPDVKMRNITLHIR